MDDAAHTAGPQKKRPLWWRCRARVWVPAAAALVLAAWWQTPAFVYWATEQFCDPNLTMAERGQYGDMFGSTNALFSGLAFLGLIVAILLQRRDLQVNSDILQQSKNEMKETNRALNEQTAQMQYAGLLSALQVLIEQEKARLHTLAPQFFLPAAEAGYTVESIEAFVSMYLTRTNQAPYTERFAHETAVSHLPPTQDNKDTAERKWRLNRRIEANNTFNQHREEILQTMDRLKAHLRELADTHQKLRARLPAAPATPTPPTTPPGAPGQAG